MRWAVAVRPGPGRWRPVMFVAAFVALVAMGVFYTRHVQRESERKWCEVLGILTAGPPPETERSLAVAAAAARLEAEFGCT